MKAKMNRKSLITSKYSDLWSDSTAISAAQSEEFISVLFILHE